jgi:phage-related protein
MNVIELFAKFVMDTSDLDKGLKGAESKLSSFSSVVGSGLAGAAKLGAAALATTATVAVGAATAVAAVAKQSANAYAEYQQLQGGIQTLFNDGGKAAAEYRAELEATNATEAEIARAMANFEDPTATVMENAANAYKTAGMSANQYMNTVINMAASLNKSTGDMEESTKLADMAITDMSDNVNKMGTTMEMVENAYRGFTRGNFTMLDNLALGYSGSQAGMEELLADAEKISGIKYDISSYADIVQAIHVVQTEMGITGTTAEEAADTISGSAGALSAAWDNLILGLADKNADLGELINNVVESAKTAFTNILPVFTQAVRGIGDLVGQIAPVIADELPGIIDQVLPPLLDTASSLITSVIDAIPGLLGVLEQNSEMLINNLLDIINTLIDSISSSLPDLIPAITDGLSKALDALTSADTITKLANSAVTLMQSFTAGIINAIPTLLKTLPMLLGNLVSGVFGAIGELMKVSSDKTSNPIIEAFQSLFSEETMNGILESIKGAITMSGDALIELGGVFLDFFSSALNEMSESDETSEGIMSLVMSTIDQLFVFLEDYLPKFEQKMIPILEKLWPTIIRLAGKMFEKYAEIVGVIAQYIPEIVSGLVKVLVDSGTLQILITGYVDVFKAVVHALPDIIKPLLMAVPSIIVDLSTAFMDCTPDLIECGFMIVAAIVAAIPDIIKALVDEAPNITDALIEVFTQNDLMQKFVEMVTDVWDGVKSTGENKLAEIWETITTKLDEIWQGVLNFLEPILSILVPYWEAVGNLFRSLLNLAATIFALIWQTIRNKLEEIWSKIQEVWQAIIDFISPILDDIKAKVEEIWNGIVDFITPVIDGLKTTIDEAFQFIYDNAVQPLLDLKDKVEEIFNGIKDFILEFVDGALNWGGDMINNFAEGMTGGIDKLTGAIDTVTGKLSANLEHSVPDEGPLSDDDKWMPDMMQSFAKGIRDNTRLVDNAIVDAFDFRGMLGGNGTPGGGGLITPTASQPIQVTLVLDKQQLGKVVFDLNNQERQRVGVTLGKEAFA